MSIAWKEMTSGATLTAVPTAQYSTPAGTSATIQAVSAFNPTAAPVTFAMYRVPTGKAADSTTCICTRVIAAGALIQGHEAINHKLAEGSRIMASGLGLTLNISGVEYVPGT